MAIIAPGTPAPDFTLRTEGGGTFTRRDLEGHTTVLVFFPFAFSEVCTDQFRTYQDVLGEITQQSARIYGVSTDAPDSQRAFRRSLHVEIPMLSDFEPKGAASRAFGAFFEPAGMATRALVVTGPDAVVRWSWIGEHPGILPGAELVLDGLAAAS